MREIVLANGRSPLISGDTGKLDEATFIPDPAKSWARQKLPAKPFSPRSSYSLAEMDIPAPVSGNFYLTVIGEE